MAQKIVKLYGLSTCPSCGRVRKFLDDNGIKHEEILVDLLEGGEQWLMTKELKKYNPEATYPTIVIEEVIVSFDEAAVKKALGME